MFFYKISNRCYERSFWNINTWKGNKERKSSLQAMKKTGVSTNLSKGSNLLKATQLVGAELRFGSRTARWLPKAFPPHDAPPGWHHPPGQQGRSNPRGVPGCTAFTSKEARPCKHLKSEPEQKGEKEGFRVIHLNLAEDTDQGGPVRRNMILAERQPLVTGQNGARGGWGLTGHSNQHFTGRRSNGF